MTDRCPLVAACFALSLGCGGVKPAPATPSPSPTTPAPAPAGGSTAPDLGPEPAPAGGDLGGPAAAPGDMGKPVPASGTATVSGAVNGYTVASVKSVFAVVTPTSFAIYVADRADVCPILQAGSSPRSTSFLRLGSVAGSGPHTFPAGAYTFPSGAGSGGGNGMGGGNGGGTGGGGSGNGTGTHDAVIATSDGSCAVSGYDQASSGSFTLTAPVDGNAKSVDGTFDVTFTIGATTGELKGSFSAPVCPGATDIPYTPVYCE